MYKHVERPQGFASDQTQEKMFSFEGMIQDTSPMPQDRSFESSMAKTRHPCIIHAKSLKSLIIQVVSFKIAGQSCGGECNGPVGAIHRYPYMAGARIHVQTNNKLNVKTSVCVDRHKAYTVLHTHTQSCTLHLYTLVQCIVHCVNI